MASIINLLKNYYGLNDEDYLRLTRPLAEVKLLDPEGIKGMKEAVERIRSALDQGEKIIVYGDYDCDGVAATAIMKRTFDLLHYKIATYLPSRYRDGYGLSRERVREYAEEGFRLIITVDNGIGCREEIKLAGSLGVDVIIVDHHEAPAGELPPARAIIHPIVSGISDVYGCGAYMALFLSAALLGRYEGYLVTLAGLATVSDMMELVGYNRDVVRLAVRELNERKYPALWALTEGNEASELTFGLEIAPKINAVGRMIEDERINLLVEYLTSEDPHRIEELAAWIRSVNDERKELTRSLSELMKPEDIGEAAIVAELPVKEGLLGLIANRLLEKYEKPVLLLAPKSLDKSELVGSARSRNGMSVIGAFSAIGSLLLASGGHELAGGCTIRAEDFAAVKSGFAAYAAEHPFREEETPAIPIKLADVNEESYKEVRSLAPFGTGFREPLFALRGIVTKNLRFSRDGRHLLTDLTWTSRLTGFGIARETIMSHRLLDVTGVLRESLFRGRRTIEFRIGRFSLRD